MSRIHGISSVRWKFGPVDSLPSSHVKKGVKKNFDPGLFFSVQPTPYVKLIPLRRLQPPYLIKHRSAYLIHCLDTQCRSIYWDVFFFLFPVSLSQHLQRVHLSLEHC